METLLLDRWVSPTLPKVDITLKPHQVMSQSLALYLGDHHRQHISSLHHQCPPRFRKQRLGRYILPPDIHWYTLLPF